MKRDPRLQPLSREHHHALVLARHLERAPWSAAMGVDLQRPFEGALEPHFALEERVLLPALSAAGGADMVAQVLEQHGRLRALARAAVAGDAEAARTLGAELRDHVRFEEQVVFPACEALPGVLDGLAREGRDPL